MNKFIKGLFVFNSGVVGGFVLCGITVVKTVTKSKVLTSAIKKAAINEVSGRIIDILYGENVNKRTQPTHSGER